MNPDLPFALTFVIGMVTIVYQIARWVVRNDARRGARRRNHARPYPTRTRDVTRRLRA